MAIQLGKKMPLTWKTKSPNRQGSNRSNVLPSSRIMENCRIKNLEKELWKNIENKQSYIHLKSEKQLKMCDPQIFCAFKHRNEPPSRGYLADIFLLFDILSKNSLLAMSNMTMNMTGGFQGNLKIYAQLTSGTKGGSMIPASNRFQLIFLNRVCDFTSLAWLFLQPNRCLGSFCKSWKTENAFNSKI